MRATGPQCFLRDQTNTLMLALIARNAGQRPSVLAGLDPNSPAALDFDLACLVRTQQYDIECDEMQAKRIALEVAKLWVGDTDAPAPNVIHA